MATTLIDLFCLTIFPFKFIIPLKTYFASQYLFIYSLYSNDTIRIKYFKQINHYIQHGSSAIILFASLSIVPEFVEIILTLIFLTKTYLSFLHLNTGLGASARSAHLQRDP